MTAKKINVVFAGAPVNINPSLGGFEDRFAATGYNTGNMLIGDGLARLLDVNILPRDSLADREGAGKNIDCLVIPAANFLSPHMDLSWLLSVLESRDLPVMMIGVGAQFPNNRLEEAVLPDVAVRVMKIVSERTKVIGVRGEFTASVLNKYEIKNVEVTGCPSLYRSGLSKLHIKKPNFSDLKLVFNGSTNVTNHSHSPANAKNAESKILRYATSSASPYVLQNEVPEMKVVECVASTKDFLGCEATLKTIRSSLSLPEYLTYLKLHGRVFYDLAKWQNFMANYSLSVGTRFHGNVMALSQGIATMTIVHDSRTLELCNALSIPFVKIEDFIQLKMQALYESLDFSKFEKEYPNNRARMASVIERNGIPHRLMDGVDFFNGDTVDFNKVSNSSPVDVYLSKGVRLDDSIVDELKTAISNSAFEKAVQVFSEMNVSHGKYLGCAQLLAHSLLDFSPDLSLFVSEVARVPYPLDLKLAAARLSAFEKLGRIAPARELANSLMEIAQADDSEWAVHIKKFSNS